MFTSGRFTPLASCPGPLRHLRWQACGLIDACALTFTLTWFLITTSLKLSDVLCELDHSLRGGKKKECRHLAEVGVFLATLKWLTTVAWVRSRADSLGCRSPALKTRQKRTAGSLLDRRFCSQSSGVSLFSPHNSISFSPCF